MRKGVIFSTFLFSTIVLAQPQKGITVVPIGLASNFSETSSSSSNPFGNYFRDGVTLALSDLEPRLKEGAIKFKVEEFDFGNSQFRVLDAAKKAAASDVIAVLGYNFSSHVLLAAPTHQKAHLPMLTPSATAERIGKFGRYIHQGCFGGKLMGETLATIAVNRLKSKRVAMVVAGDCAYCQSLADSFKNKYESLGGQATSFSVLEDDRDFSDLVTKLRASDFDAVLVPNQELTSARIISALLKGGIKKPFLGGDGWGNVGSEFFHILAGQDFQGFSLSHWHPDLQTPRSKAFVAAYKKRFGKDPNDTSVLAYDSMLLLGEVVLKAKNFTREGVEDSFEKLKEFSGVTGKFNFDEPGPPRKSLILLGANGSKFKILQVIQPESTQKSLAADVGQP